ncbi:DUF2937 family protein [Kistimonas asteriae]|uniref:DUF2937 family protein n=1 Tax=Kistimonas asteriae TaxID=517724 RepID=UPI001BADCF40|nr:DUF2937 family protein [Kistimonas asteriae]
MIRGYFRLLLFSVCLLTGIQVPGFIDQYQKRIDAHFREAAINLSGFQATADQYFEGSMNALINHYQSSPDPVFTQDASSVRQIYDRYLMLEREQAALSQPWYRVALHVASRYGNAFFNETLSSFSHSIPMTWQAISWGAGFAFLVTFLCESLLIALLQLIGLRRKVAMKHTA